MPLKSSIGRAEQPLFNNPHQPYWTIQPNRVQRVLGNLKVCHTPNRIPPMGKVSHRIGKNDLDAEGKPSFSIRNPKSTKVLEHGLNFSELGLQLDQIGTELLGKIRMPPGVQSC